MRRKKKNKKGPPKKTERVEKKKAPQAEIKEETKEKNDEPTVEIKIKHRKKTQEKHLQEEKPAPESKEELKEEQKEDKKGDSKKSKKKGKAAKKKKVSSAEKKAELKAFKKSPEYKKRLWNARKKLAIKLAIIAGVCFAAFYFVVGVTIVRGNDMAPELKDGDIVVYMRLDHEYGNQDTVLVEKDGKTRILRIIATSGTEIGKTENGLLTIDGRIHPPVHSEGIYTDTPAKDYKYPLVVSAGSYWLLGDNREAAKDSRDFGEIKKEDIKGKVFTVIRGVGI